MVSEAFEFGRAWLPSLASLSLENGLKQGADAASEPDEAWVERARRQPDAFAELVRRYQGRIYTLTYRMTGNREDANDLTQEAFIRAYDALSTFRPDGRFSSWLYRIAVNHCLNHLRKRRDESDLGDAERWTASGSTEDQVERRELGRALQRAILGLPAHYRSAVLLRHITGLSYGELAQALDLPLGTVKVRLHRAREMLSLRLRAEGVEGV